MSGEGVVWTSTPCPDGTPLLCGLAEDETKKHVETTDNKKEEGSHEGEIVNVLRKD